MKKYKITVDSLNEAHRYFCHNIRNGRCFGCPLSFDNVNRAQWCGRFVQEFPDRAAELMNVEIVEVKEPPKLTKRELEICKAVGAKWVSRGYESENVNLWKSKPLLIRGGKSAIGLFITDMNANLFPNVKPETIIKVEDN